VRIEQARPSGRPAYGLALRTFASRLQSWRRAWTPTSGLPAAIWSAGYGLFGAYWWNGGAGFPYGVGNDPAARLSLLGGVTQATTAPAITALGLIGTMLAIGMTRGSGTGWSRVVVTGFGLAIAVALTLLIPDYRVFVFVAYALIVVVGTPFGLDPGVLTEVLTPAMLNQIACMAGGLLWAAASVGYWRRSGGARPYGSRDQDIARWFTAERAEAWGRRATYAAVAVPILYALTRYTWALGMPLGISEELLRKGQESGLWLIGAALATLALVGALTFGLVRRWG
jgi:hypothetical protein